jgi:hypothetical protein
MSWTDDQAKKITNDTAFLLPLCGQIAPLGATDLRSALGQAQEGRSAPAGEAIGRAGGAEAGRDGAVAWVALRGGSEWCPDGLEKHWPGTWVPFAYVACGRCGMQLQKVPA